MHLISIVMTTTMYLDQILHIDGQMGHMMLAGF
jgi:hypothetical protein